MANQFSDTFTLPESVTSARQRAEKLTSEAQDYKAGEISVIDALRQKVTEAFSANQDIISKLDQSVANYISAPSVAREKYLTGPNKIANPFSVEKLVSQYVANEAIPMLSWSSILGQRMGGISDLVEAGTRAYGAEVQRAQGAAQLGIQGYENALQEFSLLESLKERAERLNIAQEESKLSREKFDWEKTQPTGGGTAGERLASTERQRLQADVEAGATFRDVILRYADILTTSQIREAYNQYSKYGAAKEPESTVQLWLSGKEPEEEVTSDSRPWYQKAANFFGIY